MNTTPDNDDRSTDPWEDEMTSEFDRRVRDLHEAPLTLDQVKGKAMNIRRKRRAAVAGGILAAAAVIVPVAVVAGNGLGGDRAEVAPATSTPSPTATDPAPDETTTVPVAAAQPAYVEGRQFHRPDGSVSELPSAAYEGAVLLGDLVLAQRRDNQGVVTVDVVEGGAVTDTLEAGSGLRTSAAQDLAGFVTPAGEVRVFWAGGDRVLAEGYQGYQIRGLVGGADCADVEGPTCRVALSDDGTSTQEPAVLDASGADVGPVPGAIQVNDAGPDGRYLTLTRIEDDGSCGALRDAEREVLTTCEHTLVQLSPGGDFVLAYPSYLSGFGPYTMSLLDAETGEVVAEATSDERSALSLATWVDDDTIALTRLDFGAQEWTLLTLSVGDSGPSVLAGPAPGGDDAPAFGILGR